MKNFNEAIKLFNDAKQALARGKSLMIEKDYRWATQCAQVCIELSAKAVISCFTEFEWTHNPSRQLLEVIEKNKHKIIEIFGEGVIEELRQIAEDCEFAYPWHGRSVYGEIISANEYVSAVDICTEDVAKDLINRAERTHSIVEKFINIWFK